MLTSLLYVSRSTIPPKDARTVVDQIVATAIAQNPRFGITGGLLFTGTFFAQLLEGRAADIDALMLNLNRDERHDQLEVVERVPLGERRFTGWSMCYFGPSQFVSRHVTRVLNESSPDERQRAAAWLARMLREFAAD